MSDRKLARAVRTLIRQISRLSRSMTKALMTWLLRLALVGNRRRRYATGGFVLPTTVLLILVVSLTTGALTYRAFNSSTRTIGETQNRVIYNAATPAVDRARAKLDYLFDDKKDPRYPGGVPSVNFLTSMLLNREVNSTTGKGAVVGGVWVASRATTTGKPDGADPYTFPGEDRLDIDGDSEKDNAWVYRADTDGNGSEDATIVYSLVLATPANQAALLSMSDQAKATGEGKKLDSGDTHIVPFVRNGPLSNAKASGCGGSSTTGKTKIEGGWYEDPTNTSILRKNFQIDALVIPDGKGTPGSAAIVPGALATLELQQDRQISRGNKWGAWFRNDLEVFPGSEFNWNGAMHTEGSLILGSRNSPGNFAAYLVSSPSSCLFYESASEISVTRSPEQTPFTGLVVSGQVLENAVENSNNPIHIHKKPNPDISKSLTQTNDSLVSSKKPAEIVLNPEVLQKNNGYEAADGSFNITSADTTQATNGELLKEFEGRIRMKAEKAPYVDDGYRADNRYGPKQKYNAEISIPTGKKVGDPITGEKSVELTGDTAEGTDKSAVGLDGYWERRGRNEGLRILVGQRLELGNAFGWVAPQNRPAAKQDPAVAPTPPPASDTSFANFRDSAYTAITTTTPFGGAAALPTRPDPDTSDHEGDPLYPPTETLSHESRQRRALRDNLSAVQATAVYHAAVNKDEPIACIATTSHFGSPFAIQRSISFLPTQFKSGSSATDTELLVDFFNGRGTNGLEFTPPTVADITSSTSAMGIALRNLANFAGEYEITPTGLVSGAYPPTQEEAGAGAKIHPDPYRTMWGNFSNLKRAINLMGTDGGKYGDLSPADKTYLHTAACTLGMLAYNIDQLQKFEPTNASNDIAIGEAKPLMQFLGDSLFQLMNGDVSDGEVLPKEQLSTYAYGKNSSPDQEKYNPRDYDRVPAEAFLGKLRETRLGGDGTNRAENDRVVRMAELILTSMQVRRDRTYGFRPSPAANTWNYNPYVIHDPVTTTPAKKPLLWSSACDPNIFALADAPASKLPGDAQFAPYTETTPPELRGVEQQRLGLSRLCGTVIPSAAVHDFPGDTTYPARGNTTVTARPRLPRNDATTLMTAAASDLNFPFEPPVNTAFAAAPLVDITKDKPYTLAQVAPKWPALYYVFPESAHDHDGAVSTVTVAGTTYAIDHRQPGNETDIGTIPPLPTLVTLPAAFRPWDEPYIKNVTSTVTYNPVQSTALTGYPSEPRVGYTVASEVTFKSGSDDKKLTYETYGGFLPPDLSVSSVAISPPTTPQLPSGNPASAVAQNTMPNRILTASGVKAVPFLDRVLFNGREGLPSRVLDTDIGMLRRSRPSGQVKTNTEYAPNDVWLPASGLIYAFREDAVREDDINRPGLVTTCASTDRACTNARVPGSETDPKLAAFGISLKPVDYVPDPDRRIHGFRLRNATQLRRHQSLVGSQEFKDDKNIRGIDFVSDNSVYLMGPYNLHQEDDKGTKEDDGDPTNQDNRIEEFLDRLPIDKAYTPTQFYQDRTRLDTRFADPDKDRWRPSAILADSTGILSDNFCDGSALDGFMTTGADPESASSSISTTTYSGNPLAQAGTNGEFGNYPYKAGLAKVYGDTTKALYAPGCMDGKRTSFLNQNRPKTQPPAGWSWSRENPADIFSPIKISRNGNGFLIPPTRTSVPAADPADPTKLDAAQQALAQKQRVLADYDTGLLSSNDYYTSSEFNKRALQEAKDTRVNTILVSGIVPSRQYQSYGGMHNFPRFLENWGEKFGTSKKSLWFAGSFLQLSFSNAATAPFDLVVTEPNGTKPSSPSETIPYYEPPRRLWGYDPALLLAPAGPIASRFVSTDITRSEFYSEVAANDPYIKTLCQAVEGSIANLKCPT